MCHCSFFALRITSNGHKKRYKKRSNQPSHGHSKKEGVNNPILNNQLEMMLMDTL
jgi:hypothetical protein